MLIVITNMVHYTSEQLLLLYSNNIIYLKGVHAWDYAAGEMIVREAGGYACDPSGSAVDLMSRRILVASSKELAEAIIPHLTQFYPQPRDD